jgi:hypothetical protein
MPHDPHSGGPGSNQYGKKPKKFTGDDITVDALTELIGEESGMDDGSTSASAPATWKPVPPQLPSLGEISGQKIVAKAPIVITAEDGSAHTELFHGGVTHLGNLSTFTAADGTQQTWFYANADTIGDMDARAFADPQDAVQHAAAMKMSADTDPPPVITAPAAPLPAQTSTDKARGALEAAAAEQAPSVASVRKARWDAREKLAGALTSLEGRRARPGRRRGVRCGPDVARGRADGPGPRLRRPPGRQARCRRPRPAVAVRRRVRQHARGRPRRRRRLGSHRQGRRRRRVAEGPGRRMTSSAAVLCGAPLVGKTGSCNQKTSHSSGRCGDHRTVGATGVASVPDAHADADSLIDPMDDIAVAVPAPLDVTSLPTPEKGSWQATGPDSAVLSYEVDAIATWTRDSGSYYDPPDVIEQDFTAEVTVEVDRGDPDTLDDEGREDVVVTINADTIGEHRFSHVEAHLKVPGGLDDQQWLEAAAGEYMRQLHSDWQIEHLVEQMVYGEDKPFRPDYTTAKAV